MRKLAVVGATALVVLLVAAVAYAQQVNTYQVVGSTAPGKPGAKKKPLPIQLKFDYSVGEAAGLRPSPVKRYTIGFYGVKSNGGLFPKCTAEQINAAQSDTGCVKGSKVGIGTIINQVGASNNPSDKSIDCNLNLTLYNGGQGRLAIYLSGGPTTTVAGKTCIIPITQAIDARYVGFQGGGTALQFDVPSNLLHSVPGLDTAVTQVTSTIDKMTVKKGGQARGYYESVACKGKNRPIQVTFLSEAGETKSASYNAKC
jgi:hypothetical protein